jgi:hypothetical protein
MSTTPGKTIRSVKDIRTHAGSVDHTAVPYKAYMRISGLEMEKARRIKEKKNIMDRVTQIDNRIIEIEAEKNAITDTLKQLEDSQPGTVTKKNKAVSKHHGAATDPSVAPITDGFKIRY